MPTCLDLVLRRPDESWRALRRRRATTPAAASSPERAATFRGALEQAEQQMRAAASIDYDSRALNLFYGLSQGGRALAAASPSLTDEKFKLSGHGLTSSWLSAGSDITAVQVTPWKLPKDERTSFVRLSSVLDSPLTGPITLGQLWSLMYETTVDAPLGDVSYPPLQVERTWSLTGPDPSTRFDEASVAIPAHIGQMPVAKRPEVMAYLSHYPAVRDAVFYDHRGGLRPAHDADWVVDSGSVLMRWETPRRFEEHPEYLLDQQATLYRGQKLAMPAAPGCETSLHPLMVWWQVLHALSMLTRYDPARWTSMIDIDALEQTVAIEYVLDLALAAVPDLLDEALDQLDQPVSPSTV